MIKCKVVGVALAVLTVVASAACAAPGSSPSIPARPSPLPTSVAPGCDLSGTRVHWSKSSRQPRLTRVTLFRGEAPDGHIGEEILAEPFTSSIAHVAAPDDWPGRLAKSLSAETGDKIHAEPAQFPDRSFGLMSAEDDPSIQEILLYEAVEEVSAGFSVDCDRTIVSGVFTAWTSTSSGGVTCGQREEPVEPEARLARRYCPRTPSPHRSSVDEVPFDLILPGE